GIQRQADDPFGSVPHQIADLAELDERSARLSSRVHQRHHPPVVSRTLAESDGAVVPTDGNEGRVRQSDLLDAHAVEEPGVIAYALDRLFDRIDRTRIAQ